MKREIWKKASVLLLAGTVIVGCGEKKVSDDMDVEEAKQYAYKLLEENKDSSAEDLYGDMVDDAVSDFMGDLENGEEVTELPDGLNLKQLVEIKKEHPELVKIDNGGDRSDDPIDYFVFDDYKITKEYWDNTSISQKIADLYNNVEWERVGVGGWNDYEDTVDLSSAKKVKKYIEEQIDEKGKLKCFNNKLYFHFVYYETKDCYYADELYIEISLDDINEESTNNYMGLNYTVYYADDREGWNYCCFSRKEDGKYYIFGSNEDVFEQRNWSKDDL